MPRKMVGYILLSFLSFFFFTIVFNVIAIAQVSAAPPSPQNPPIPTIYTQQNETAPKQTTQQTDISTPTPTVFATKQVNGATIQTGEIVQPTATPIPPTATPTPTALPTATPTPQPTITTTSDLETLFGKYSSQYSVNEDELKKIANCESGFNSSSF